MKMKTQILLVFFIFFFQCAFSQKIPAPMPEVPTTSFLMKDISYFWKMDSLGNNGYRNCSAYNLLKSKLDTISRNYLIDKLGKPTRISIAFNGYESYIYNIFDATMMNSNYRGPLSTVHIFFLFKKNDLYVSIIDIVDNDR